MNRMVHRIPSSTKWLEPHQYARRSGYEHHEISISYAGSIAFSWLGGYPNLLLEMISFSYSSSLTERDK
jgi:hypothetical protein